MIESLLLQEYWPENGPFWYSSYCEFPADVMPQFAMVLNTIWSRQNGCHFADDNFKCIFLNEGTWISIDISLNFVPKCEINNIPALVQIMACCRSWGKPLSEPMMVSLLTYICITRPQWVKKSMCFISFCFCCCHDTDHYLIKAEWHIYASAK